MPPQPNAAVGYALLMLLAIAGGCRIEPVDGGPLAASSRGMPSWSAGPGRALSSRDATAVLLGLMPDAAALERSAQRVCAALSRGVGGDAALQQALAALECERRGHGELFSEALLIGPGGRWGAAAAIPSASLSTDAALAAYAARRGLHLGVVPPLPLSDCGPGDLARDAALARGWSGAVLPDSLEAHAVVEALELDLGLELPDEPDALSDDDGGVGQRVDLPVDPPTGAEARAHAQPVPADGTDTPHAEAGAVPPPQSHAGALGVPAVGRAGQPQDPPRYALVLRTATGSLHAGLLAGARGATASSPVEAPALPHGFDVLPGQLVHIGARGAVLVAQVGPRDPLRAPAPAAEHYQRELVAQPKAARDTRAALAWILPSRGEPHPTRATTPVAFAALSCPAIIAAESASPSERLP